MPTIIFSPTAQLQQVEDFPDNCERTIKGAIYVRPGGTCVVSDCEAAHLKSKGIVFTVAGAPKLGATASTSPAPTPAKPPSAPKAPLPGLPSNPFGGAAPTGAQSDTEQK